jgi:hypothetical protein
MRHYFGGDIPNIISGLNTAKWWVTCVKRFSYWIIFETRIASELVFDCVGDELQRKIYNKLAQTVKEKDIYHRITDEKFIASVFTLIGRKYDVLRFFTNGDKLTGIEAADRVIADLQVQICVKKADCIAIVCKYSN